MPAQATNKDTKPAILKGSFDTFPLFEYGAGEVAYKISRRICCRVPALFATYKEGRMDGRVV